MIRKILCWLGRHKKPKINIKYIYEISPMGEIHSAWNDSMQFIMRNGADKKMMVLLVDGDSEITCKHCGRYFL